MKTLFSISVIAGCIFIASGLYMFVKAYDFFTHSTKTTGRVISMSYGDVDGATTYHPVVVFTNLSGIEHTQQSSYGSSTFNFKPGEPIAVRYTSERVEVDSFESIWLFPVSFIAMGVFFIIGHFRWLRKMKLKKINHVA